MWLLKDICIFMLHVILWIPYTLKSYWKVHDQCINLYLFLFFLFPRLLQTSLSFFVLRRVKQKKKEMFVLVWKFRKAWHIWDDNSLFSSRLILLLDSFFYRRVHVTTHFCCLTRRQTSTKVSSYAGGGESRQGLTHLG